MIYSFCKIVLPLFFISTIVYSQFMGGGGINITFFTVEMTNKLPHLQLSVHCKDKNIDLGIHKLDPGKTYSFDFMRDIVGSSTLYFCGFRWRGEFHYFDIYVESRDYYCKICVWEIEKSGPCRIKINERSRVCYPWNNHKI